jgi:hypothetical protein
VATGLEKLLEDFAEREDGLIAELATAVAVGDKEKVFLLATALVGADAQNEGTRDVEQIIWRRAKR